MAKALSCQSSEGPDRFSMRTRSISEFNPMHLSSNCRGDTPTRDEFTLETVRKSSTQYGRTRKAIYLAQHKAKAWNNQSTKKAFSNWFVKEFSSRACNDLTINNKAQNKQKQSSTKNLIKSLTKIIRIKNYKRVLLIKHLKTSKDYQAQKIKHARTNSN